MGPTESTCWSSEKLFFDGDDFFADLLNGIAQAQNTIDLETYIFDTDAIGYQFLEALTEAKERGVKVRLLVDGFGSMNWIEKLLPSASQRGINVKVYHPLPWPFSRYLDTEDEKHTNFLHMLSLSRHRNHRKVCIIDGKTAWTGSMNISANHSLSLKDKDSWYDISVRVEGASIWLLTRAFEKTWKKSKGDEQYHSQKIKRLPAKVDPLVRLNDNLLLRRASQKDLFRKMRHAEKRVWVVSAYFMPVRRLIRSLQIAARRGVDVRLIFPRKSDVFLSRLAARYFYGRLLNTGIKIYEYLPRILHAKAIVIDDWSVISTTNMNHRSFLYDLEVDIVLTQQDSKKQLAEAIHEDFNLCEEITLEKWKKRSILDDILGRFFYFFRGWF